MKYMAIFVKEIGKNKTSETPQYEIIGKKKFKPTDETIKFKEESAYFVDLEGCAFQDGKTKFFYYDYTFGHQLSPLPPTIKGKCLMLPKDLNKFSAKGVIECIGRGVNIARKDSSLLQMLIPIILFGVGIAIGYFMHQPTVIYQQIPNGVPQV